ncbi:MAG: amino acid transporter [Pseudorhodobacter sp.]|nr:amino acid transporter [Pseudorhodobacter sp.]
MPASEAQRYRGILSGLEFFTVKDGRFDHLPPGVTLPMDVWQLWGADIGAGRWRVDMMVDRGSPDVWVYKRDPSFTLPRAKAIRATAGGIRYLAPHIVLLFKARHAREKDHGDFRNAWPRLNSSEKSSLCRWLEVLHPGHTWIQALRPG